MLWSHDTKQPIGVWKDLRETDRGLLAKGQLNLDVQRGAEAHALIKQGAIDGLSIGYSVPKGGAEVDRDTGVRRLKRVSLHEISPVVFPMNTEARIGRVKTALQAGTLPSDRDVERWLREEGGFSQRQAKAFVARGYRGLAPHDEGELADGLDRLIASIRGAS